MSSRTAPRPILKRSPGLHPNNYPPEHHAVHFPPPINIARTFDTHSSAMYDRSPITVSPNSCALPERGCPGRTYHTDEPSTPTYFSSLNTQPGSRGHAHPRAFSRPHPEPIAMPPLVPDLSSESDESDGFSHFPASLQPSSYRNHASPTRYSNTSIYDSHPAYAPSNPAYPSPMHTPYISAPSYPQYPVDVASHKPRRRPETTHRDKQWDYRIRSSNVEADDPGYDDDADIATPISSSPERKKRSHRKTSSMPTLCKTFSGFGVQDDMNDCLGGF